MSEARTTALVIGAASELGAEYCRQLVASSQRIIAPVLDVHRLEELTRELAGRVDFQPLEADLGTVEGIARTVEALRQSGPLGYLINYPEGETRGKVASSAIERERGLVRLHIDATLSLARAAAQFMADRGRGVIINVASVAAFWSLESESAAAASQAFMLNFSRSLWAELTASGIAVQCLCDDPQRLDRAESASGQQHSSPVMAATAVVAASLAAVEQGRCLVIPDPTQRAKVRRALEHQLASLQ